MAERLCLKPCPFFASQDQSWGPWLGQVGVPVFFRVLFLLPLLGVAGLRRRGRLGRCQGGGVSFFSCQEWNASAWSGREAGRALARASFDFFPAARREPGPAVGRTAEGFFLGGVPSFFPCPPGGLGGEPQARSSSFAFFFSVFASLAEAPALQTAEGGGVQLRQGAFFPFIFPFFPLAWQDRARVELAVKARSSSLGRRPFFSCQDEKLNAAETRASVAEARVLALDREKARPFFFSGLGGTRKPVLQVDLMKEIASQARFPSFFSPLFGGVFPGQATRVAVLEEALRNEKAWKQGFQARCRASFSFPPPALPLRPRRRPSRSGERSSASRLIRRPLKSIGFAFVPGRGAAFEAWPWPRKCRAGT